MKITIPIEPRTKKNSQQIVYTKGRPILVQNKRYKDYEKACAIFMPKLNEPISEPVNVKCTFYRSTRRRVDLVNLQEAINDILVKYGVLADDNRNIIYAQDGSRVYYDKQSPRTEIEITKITDENVERWKEK